MKERIIGAVVLVVFVVLVVPVFLDGPPPQHEVVSQRVPLPGQSDQVSQTIVLERDRDEPVPSAASPDTAVPEKAVIARDQRAAPAKRDVDPPPDKTAVESGAPGPKSIDPAPPAASMPVTSATGMWAVQLGSFSNQDNAERLAADLRQQGFAAFLSTLSTESTDLVRVRVGPQKDRESAEAMAQRLSRTGHKGQVVPHP